METAERTVGASPLRRTIVLAIAVAGVVLLAPYLGIVGSMGWNVMSERAARRPFDSATWRGDTATWMDREPMRLRMVDDLLERRLLDGRTRAEVVALIGEPAHGNLLDDHHERFDMAYWLGPARGAFPSMSEEWLGIRLGLDGRVTVAKLVTRY